MPAVLEMKAWLGWLGGGTFEVPKGGAQRADGKESQVRRVPLLAYALDPCPQHPMPFVGSLEGLCPLNLSPWVKAHCLVFA